MVTRLELPHTFRVAGVAFLLLMALGHLPALFALPARLGDIATGIPRADGRAPARAGHALARASRKPLPATAPFTVITN
jgi:hypothetical protein